MTRIRTLTAGLIALGLMTIFPGAALADDTLPLFIDQAGVLTAQQKNDLSTTLEGIRQRRDFDPVIVVVPSLDNQDIRTLAEDYFLDTGYGKDGAILFVAMKEKEVSFVAFGSGVRAFTTAGQAYLDKLYLPQMKAGKYYEAFTAYANAVDDFLRQAAQSTPYDKDTIPKTPSEQRNARLIAGIIATVLSLAIAGGVTGWWRSSMTSVRKQDRAAEYVDRTSLVLTARQDSFQGTSVDSRPITTSRATVTDSTRAEASGHNRKF